MKCVQFVTLIFYVRYTTGQYVSINHKQPKLPCESSTKNSLIEHFFNIIFAEFHTTPPVCVCVQMCAGQSTYCYPNGCLKRDDLKSVDSPQASPHARNDRKEYMFVVDEKNDFMKDFLEKSYVDEGVTSVGEPMREMRPDLFKDKYNMLVKYKKMPSVELRYNLREQVKNTKSDFLKIESVDLSKTRWPMNKRNLVSGHKVHSMTGRKAPMIGKTNFFMTMLPASDVVLEYPPKYFKRDTSKTVNDDETNAKGFYLYETPDNTTDANETISLETLIDNLINNSFKTKPYDVTNETQIIAEHTINKTEEVIERTTINPKLNDKSTKLISVNFTKQHDYLILNKYTDDYTVPTTNNIKEMIINLSKRIEKQNNTSMKIAKRIIGDFNKESITSTEAYKSNMNSPFTERVIEIDETKTTNQEVSSITSADFKETMVTKKNRQRRARKLQNNKSNTQ